MKILQVIPYFCFGGAETMCENLCYALQAMGHAVTVVSLYNARTPISERMEAAGIRILYLDKKLGLDISMVPKLLRIMKQERPDVVHTHLDVVKYAAAAAKLAGIKKCVHTVHNVAEKEAEGLAQKINKVYFQWNWAAPVALSPTVQNTIVQTYEIPAQVVPVICNGMDLSRCIPKQQYTVGETVELLHIGRFNEQKNHTGLLKAFQKLLISHPQCRLTLVGEGELREEMEHYAQELDISEKICVAGSQSNVYPFLHGADIFLLPSKYEGMPMTLIEAMGTGLPIVATAVGGVADMLKDRQSALLTEVDPDAVCAACVELIENLQLRETLGRNAQLESVRFSSDYMAQQYCKVYQAK